MKHLSAALLLRATTPADAPTIVALTQAAYRANNLKTGGMYSYVFSETAADLAAQMAEMPWRILVLERDGEPVACVRISQTDPDRINLWRLAVHPAAQGAGLGKLIIAAIERWAAAWGRPWVTLGALEASPENRALYERLGFSVYGRKEMSSMPGNYYTLMRKHIVRPATNSTAARYEQIADDYNTRHRSFKFLAAHERLRAVLPPPAHVLEIGCGPGNDAAMLRAAGYTVIALDPAQAMLRLAQSSGASRVQADGRALPIATGSVDAVWASASLLHLPRLELVIALCEIRRVLRSDGMFYASLKRGAGEESSDGRWFAFYQPLEVARAITGAGFTLLEQWESADHRPGAPPWILTLARATVAAATPTIVTDECGAPVVEEHTA